MPPDPEREVARAPRKTPRAERTARIPSRAEKELSPRASGREETRDVRCLCPVCGSSALHAKPQGGKGSLFCFNCEPSDGAAWLAEAARELGTKPYRLLGDPLAYLERAQRPGSASPVPSEAPSAAKADGHHARLLADDEALDYLLGRGLTLDTIRLHKLGYDGDHDAIVIPVYDEAGEVQNLFRRFLDPDAEPKIVGLTGRPAAVWPLPLYLARPRPSVVLCEGEFDAALLNQQGFTAITSTAGTTWKPEWDRYVVGRRVAIIYDAGSIEKARRRARELRDAGASDAWAIDLARAGLGEGEDVTDWLVKYGRSRDDLAELIGGERRSGR